MFSKAENPSLIKILLPQEEEKKEENLSKSRHSQYQALNPHDERHGTKSRWRFGKPTHPMDT